MKIATLLVTGLVGAGVIGLFGHGLAVDARQQDPPTTWEQERDAMATAHKNDVNNLYATLHVYEQRINTLEKSNNTLATQRQAACQRLGRAGVTIAECR